MGKYFSDDSSLKMNPEFFSDLKDEKENITETETIHKSKIINDNIENEEQIDKDIKKINNILMQSKIVDQTMEKIIDIDPKKIEQSLKKFQPVEIFERLNQIIFMMIETNNRLTAIEKRLSTIEENNNIPTQPENKPVNKEKLSPIEQFKADNNNDDNSLSVDKIKEKLAIATSQKLPKIPSEDYIDKGIKLEEMFPEQSERAIQEAYKAMDLSNNPSLRQNASKSPKGGSTGIVF